MPRYRKKPMEIEAMHYDERADGERIVEWVVANGGDARRNGDSIEDYRPRGSSFSCHPDSDTLVIVTLEGPIYASPGDWVIRGVAGEFYPCKPDIFEATYELASELPRAIRVVFEDATTDSDPAPELRFVELENERGESINIGRWHEGDGLRWLTIDLPSVAVAPTRDPLDFDEPRNVKLPQLTEYLGLDRHKHGFVP